MDEKALLERYYVFKITMSLSTRKRVVFLPYFFPS